MIADRQFQKEAQRMAEDMQKHVKADPALKAAMAESTKKTQAQSEGVFDEEVSETIADPSFKRQQEQVSRTLHSLMSDPDLQSEAESIAFNVEQMKDSDSAHNVEMEIFKQVNSALASTKLREKASDVVLEVLSPDLQGDVSELSKAVENRTPFQLGDEWLDKEDMQELAQAVENPSPELEQAMEQTRLAQFKTRYAAPLDQHFSLWSQALSYF